MENYLDLFKKSLEEVPKDKDEPWIREVCEFVIQAHKDGKLIRSFYQGIVFTPEALAREMCNGRFRWGVVNWETVDRKDYKRIDYK